MHSMFHAPCFILHLTAVKWRVRAVCYLHEVAMCLSPAVSVVLGLRLNPPYVTLPSCLSGFPRHILCLTSTFYTMQRWRYL